jgi:glycosyltransferase involved in cell wall biosynthesis
MQQLIFVYPGDLSAPTGGYAYDRHIIHGLKCLGWQLDLISLGDGYPFPTAIQVEQARKTFLSCAKGVPIVIDGLALGALPGLAAELAMHHPLIALIHHPLAFESGLSETQKIALQQSEAEALKHVSQVIANSPTTARDLTQYYGTSRDLIEVVMPGTERVHRPKPKVNGVGSPSNGVHLLSVGSIIPRKGFDCLMEALYPLTDLPWTLSIAGDTSRNPLAYKQLLDDIERFHFADRVRVLGAISEAELERLYASADIFVLASRFEGYGMVYAEAMTHGLPIVATTGGAIPDTVPPEAGVLVAPGDVAALSMALRDLILDAPCRARLSCGALEAAARLPTWDQSVQQFAASVRRVTPLG